MTKAIINGSLLLAALTLTVAFPSTASAQSDRVTGTVGNVTVTIELSDDAGSVPELNAADKGVYTCARHKRLVLDGKKMKKKTIGGAKTPLVIHASQHCKVTVRNLTITGRHAIRISEHASLTLDNVKVNADKVAIFVTNHGSVKIKRSTIRGEQAVNASDHAVAHYDAKSKITGRMLRSRHAVIKRK